MKHLFTFLFVLILVLGYSMQSHAALTNRGTDSLGNRLIYDSDLNITWYDYTKSATTWRNQMDWANALTVNFYGAIYDDWRLPKTVNGGTVFGYNGSSGHGFNITSGEMGHLFYTELGNRGAYDTSGNRTDCFFSSSPWCLTNKGDFQNLQSKVYWSDTESAVYSNNAWFFKFVNGSQSFLEKDTNNFYAIAVRPGDVAISGNPVAPEPISSILFVTGGSLLLAIKYVKRLRMEL